MITDRLILRGWRDDDLDVLAAMNADPEVMRYIMDGSVRDREQSAAGLRRMMDGGRMFAVELRSTGTLIGWAGFAAPEFLPEVMPAVEIGWRFTWESWGHGYATEAAAAALRHGFADLGLDRVISIRHVDNVRSARVMAKIGLVHEFDTVVPGHGQPVSVHAIDRARYQSATNR